MRGVGGATLAIPFLPSLVHGQVQAPRPFLVALPFREGMHRWYTWSHNTTVPFTTVDADTKIRSLQSIVDADGKISPILDEQWNPFLSKMNLFTHLSMYMKSNLHSAHIMLACANGYLEGNVAYGGPHYSMDYLIHESLKRRGYNNPLGMLMSHLNWNLFPDYNRLSHWGTSNPSSSEIMNTPAQLGQKIKAAFPSQSGGTAPTNRQKLVDAVIEDYRKLVGDRRISSVDKTRLQDSMDLWNEVGNQEIKACTLPPDLVAGGNIMDEQKWAIDMIVAAISCGLTQVVNFGLIHLSNSLCRTRNESEVVRHDWAHGYKQTQDNPFPYSWGKWRADVVRYFAERLTVVRDETGAALLDSGLLFWTTEFPGGGNHPAHGRTVVTLGGLGGKLKTGFHVNATNAPLSRAHITVMKAFGLTQAEIEVKGTAGFGEYETPYYDNPWTDTAQGRAETDPEAMQTGEFRKAGNQWIFGSGNWQRFMTDTEKRKAFTGFVQS